MQRHSDNQNQDDDGPTVMPKRPALVTAPLGWRQRPRRRRGPRRLASA